MYLMDFLVDKKVDIVTPNTYLLSRIPNDFPGKVFLLGGEFNKKSDICFGDLTIEMMKNFHFDYAFLTANGIDFSTNEVYGFRFGYAALKKEALTRSNRVELLVDSTKTNKRGLCVWAHTKQFHGIFMDSFDKNLKKPSNVVICE